MDSKAALLWGVLFGSIGLPNTLLLMLVGVLLMAIPYFIRM